MACAADNKKAGSKKIRLSLLEVPVKAKPPEGNTRGRKWEENTPRR
jgi:hypothetical protein